jgi:flagellar biosynthesis/type III secretory pathway chaperone
VSQASLLQDIAELLEREHRALEAHDIEALTEIQGERRSLLVQLGPAARDERPAFATLEFLRARNERAAQASLDRLGVALGRIGKGRTALAGYRTSVSSNVFSRALDQEA